MSNYLTLEQAQQLEAEAKANGGRCTRCHQTVKIYRYSISGTIVRVLQKMAEATMAESGRAIDVDRDVNLTHSEHSQLTKMRLLGLIAKVKVNNKHAARQWLITSRGWGFRRKEPVPAKVVVYNNQVLGHEGGTITIDRADGDAGVFESTPITEAESRVYADVRTPKKNMQIVAEYKGSTTYDKKLVKGTVYDVNIKSLKFGQPVVMLEPVQKTYKDMAAFYASWKVVK